MSTAVVTSEEMAHDAHVPLPFLQHREVRALGENRDLRAANPSMDTLGDARRDLVVLPAGDERGHVVRRQPMRDVPVPKGTLDREIAGPTHRPVVWMVEFAHRPRLL